MEDAESSWQAGGHCLGLLVVFRLDLPRSAWSTYTHTAAHHNNLALAPVTALHICVVFLLRG